MCLVVLFASYHRRAEIRPAQIANGPGSGALRTVFAATQLLTLHRPAITFAATADYIIDFQPDRSREPLIKSIMNRVADKNGMIARRATPVAAATRYWRSQPLAGVAACCHSRTRRFAHRVMAAVILRCQGAQHRERPFLSQPTRALALRAVCYVRLLAKGITIRIVAFLASHPAKPNARSCGT